MKEEGTKTPTELEGVRGKEGESLAIEGKRSREQFTILYNAVLHH